MRRPPLTRRQIKPMLDSVDDFLADRLRADSPAKVAAKQQSDLVLGRYYDKKFRKEPNGA